MAKSGFSVSQRRKVQTITGTDAVAVTAADCGTMFVITDDVAHTITLPAVADAGSGWHCKFVLGVDQTAGDSTITSSSDYAARLIVANDGDGSAALTSTATVVTVELNQAVAGDQVDDSA